LHWKKGKKMAHYPLQGVVILDLTQIYNGPYATYLLALAGATVIKIEPPGGESLRRRGVVGGAALPFAMLNGAKKSLCLDLKSELGKRALVDLVAGADVLVENFAPRAMDRLGLGYEYLKTLNPRLIYAASSGYGSTGPYRTYPAMDLTVQAISGVMETTGFPDRPPVKAGPAVCDFFAGIHLHAGIMTALYDRERSGVARRIEVAMQDAVYASLSSSLGLWWGSQGDSTQSPRTGNRHGGMAEAPYNVYVALDGWVAIICVGELHWKKLTVVMDRPDLAADPRFADLKSRVANVDAVDEAVSTWTRTRTKKAIFDELIAKGVPCAPVRNLDEVTNDPNMHERGALQYQDHPEYGRIIVQQTPIRFDGLEPMTIPPSHKLGEDARDVLSTMTTLGPEEIDQICSNV
jgi:CoA:oxalate CoA-transferase